MPMLRAMLLLTAVLLLAAGCAAPSGEVAVVQSDEPTPADTGEASDLDESSDDVPDAPDVGEASPVAFDRCVDLEEPSPPDGPLSTDAVVAAAQQGRAEMGLPSDIATVEALLEAHPESDGWALGFPHTEEEFDAVMARNGDLDQIGDLQEWAASTHPDTWGGLWIDQARGGVLTVAFTEAVADRVDDIADRYGMDVHGVEVTFSEAELTAAQATLEPVLQEQWEGRDGGGLQPGDVTSLSAHAPTNRLQVGMYTDDDHAKRRLAELVDPAMICLDIEEIPVEADAGPASWAPAADADLSADSTAIALDVVEQACASGMPADGRIVVQDLRQEQDAVVVTLGVVPQPGAHTCQGNPVTPFTLELDEPLGGRQLLDGAHEPPAEPSLDR